MAPGLLNMPEVVMTKIMEDAGIKAIMTLRKVCHDLRNFIDDVKPDANLEEIKVVETSNSIIVRYRYSGEINFAKYMKHKEGCLVNNSKPDYNRQFYEDIEYEDGVLLKNEDVATIFLNDFETVLRHQKSILKVFRLNDWNEFDDRKNVTFLKDIQHIMKSRVYPLKVESLRGTFEDQNQLISILTCLDSKSLSDLVLSFEEDISEIDQLTKLDQWKTIKKILILTFINYKYIQDFIHFSTVTCSFKSTHFPDLAFLKNLFLQSSGFRLIKIRSVGDDFVDDQHFPVSLGAPLVVPDYESTRKLWYYRIPASKEILEISVCHEEMRRWIPVVLMRIEQKDVEEGAVIQN